MIEFITSYSPQVHVHIDRIPIGEVPKEEEHLEKWIHARYVAKDRLVRNRTVQHVTIQYITVTIHTVTKNETFGSKGGPAT